MTLGVGGRYVVHVLDPSRAEEALRAGVIVGIAAERGRAQAGEAALAVQAGLRAAFPDRPGLAVVLTGDPADTVEAGATLVPGDAVRPPPAIHTGSATGAGPALHTLLEVAVAAGAPACALLEPMPRPADPAWLRALFDPVLRGDCDLVAPSYARRRFDGVLVTGLVYPLTRALFGQRLLQPLGHEIVLGRRLAEPLSREDAWRDPAHADTHLWVISLALVRDCRLAQVFLGPRPVPQAQPPDVSEALAGVLGTLFHDMELHASRWQRVRGSCSVATWGEEHLSGGPGQAPAPGPLVASFALGLQDLRRLWSPVLPPQALYALQRIAREPPEGFRIPDALWARVVYDFAVGWRVKAMERHQLLRSMTPLYLGWVASFVNEVAALERPEVEARIERLAATFEAEKPYLISRWRWPDRFSP